MEKSPKYYLFRILIVALFFQTILVTPPVLFTLFKNLPQNIESIKKANPEAVHNSDMDVHVNLTSKDKLKISNFIISLIGIGLFILLNIPFKLFLYRKRKKKKIAPWISKYTRKTLQFTPQINSSIYVIHSLITIYITYNFSNKISPQMENLHFQVSIIAVFATFLVSFIIYLWQENRVRLNYLPYFFTQEELRTRKCTKKHSTLYANFLFSTLVTTFLPIAIMLFYLFSNASQISDVVNKMDEMTNEQAEILYGDYLQLYNKINIENSKVNAKQSDKLIYEVSVVFSKNLKLYYNSVNTFLMISGIVMSILAAIFYIFLVTKLNVRIVVNPITELMKKMRITADGKFGEFSIVRTNNEIGYLAESFNVMSSKLKHYFDDLMEMNQNLEQKVKDRTADIEQQKEEIEAQKDEIEAQRDEIEAQRDEVVQQRDKIAGQNSQITASIQYAENIQTAILPSQDFIERVLPQQMLYFKPRDIVSGDYYWLAESNNKLIIAAADCTGHGVPGAMMSMLGVSILNEIAARARFKNPADILDVLRKEIIEALNKEGAMRESKDGMDIALCVVDKKEKTLDYAGANNSLIYFDKSGELNEIKATRNPIGVYRNQKEFENHTVKYTEDMIFYLFSDGYRDQMTPQGARIKAKGFKEILTQIHKLSFKEQYERLDILHNNWKMHGQQTDDILVWSFKLD